MEAKVVMVEDESFARAESLVIACAAAAHQVNKAWCEAYGDFSQPIWGDAPEWQKDSAIAGVKGVLAGNTPEQSHQGWMQHKAAEGWVYGAAKDPQAKTHPCMVPYSDLPPERKAKDHHFVQTVRTIASILGLNVVPASCTLET